MRVPGVRLAKLIAVTTFVSCPALAQQSHSQEWMDYQAGAGVGWCFAGGCKIFRGTVLSNPPPPDGTITVRVDKPFYGMSTPESIFEFHYDRRGSWAWQNIAIARNLPVTVIVSDHDLVSWPGEASYVATEEPDVARVKYLVDETIRLDHSPALVPGEVASLADHPNPRLAGLLFSRLAYGSRLGSPNPWQPDSLAQMYLAMLPNPSVPRTVMEEIATRLALTYALTSDPVRAEVLHRFTDFAESPDVDAAKAGFTALAHIATYFPIRTTLPPLTLSAIEANYRALVAKRSVTRNHPLEAGLGFDLGPEEPRPPRKPHPRPPQNTPVQ